MYTWAFSNSKIKLIRDAVNHNGKKAVSRTESKREIQLPPRKVNCQSFQGKMVYSQIFNIQSVNIYLSAHYLHGYMQNAESRSRSVSTRAWQLSWVEKITDYITQFIYQLSGTDNLYFVSCGIWSTRFSLGQWKININQISLTHCLLAPDFSLYSIRNIFPQLFLEIVPA